MTRTGWLMVARRRRGSALVPARQLHTRDRFRVHPMSGLARKPRPGTRCLGPLAALSLGAAGLAFGACSSSTPAASSSPPASAIRLSAQAQTVQLFDKSTGQGFFDPAGHPLPEPGPSSPPVIGEYVMATDLVYLGTEARHDHTSIGTDQLFCVITSLPNVGQCDVHIAIDGSMMYVDHQTVRLSRQGLSLSFSGGTGAFQGARGTLAHTDLPDGNGLLVLNVSLAPVSRAPAAGDGA